MTGPDAIDAWKRAAAIAAVVEVQPGMLVGLGTGSTAAHAIAEIGRRVAGGLAIRAVATSERTAAAARAAGITVIDFAHVDAVDIAIDGVDEIDSSLRAIKGGGGAMLREKIVADAARRMIAIADATKLVDRIGGRAVPVEVLPFAEALVLCRVAELGAHPTLRRDAAGVRHRTDQGNVVLDCRFERIDDPARLAAVISQIPGVLGHGIFVDEIDAIYVGSVSGVERRDRPAVRSG